MPGSKVQDSDSRIYASIHNKIWLLLLCIRHSTKYFIQFSLQPVVVVVVVVVVVLTVVGVVVVVVLLVTVVGFVVVVVVVGTVVGSVGSYCRQHTCQRPVVGLGDLFLCTQYALPTLDFTSLLLLRVGLGDHGWYPESHCAALG